MRFVPFGPGRHLVKTGLWLFRQGSEVQTSLHRPAVPAAFCEDIKGWAIRGTPAEMQFDVGGQRISVSREFVVREFMRHVLTTSRVRTLAGYDVWFMLPADHDRKRKNEYQGLLEFTAKRYLPPSTVVNFQFEPDATAEYFRLVQGKLTLRKRRNDAILIVDCGAYTCNMTLALSTREGHFGDVGTGRSRGRLAALPGQTIESRAGRYVDHLVWARLKDALGSDASSLGDADGLLLAEHLKVLVAGTGVPHTLVGPTGKKVGLTVEELHDISYSLWESYEQSLTNLLRDAWKQLAEGEGAAVYANMLRDEGVRSPSDIPKLIQGVVLAGGTAKLPGFQDALFTLLSVDRSVPVFQPQNEYPGVAALGALARILERRGRLIATRAHPTHPDSIPASEANFTSQLPDDIYLHYESGEGRGQIKLIERDRWPLAYEGDGTTRPAPKWLRVPGARVWLTYGEDGDAKWVATDHPGAFAVGRLDKDALLHVSVDRQDNVRIKFGTRVLTAYPEPSSLVRGSDAPLPEDVAKTQLLVQAAKTVVVDFGMSKTLIAAGDVDGSVSAADFEFLGAEAIEYAPPAGWIIEAGAASPPELPTSFPPSEPASPIEQGAPQDPVGQVTTQPTAQANGEFPLGSVPINGPGPDLPPTAGAEPPPSAAELQKDRTTQEALESAAVGVVAERRKKAAISESPRLPPLPARAPCDELGFLRECWEASKEDGLEFAFSDFASLHVAAKVRPLVLLAGPPGVGKSSMATAWAASLGCLDDVGNWARIAVQADWVHDRELFGREATFRKLLEHSGEYDGVSVALFDEFNLTRPEYYLSRILSAMEGDGVVEQGLHFGRSTDKSELILLGTLNVDECSRPPSDKVLDRAFLIEMMMDEVPASIRRPRLRSPTARVDLNLWRAWRAIDSEIAVPLELRQLWLACREHARGRLPHEDLTPTRRAITDVSLFMHYYDRLGLDGSADFSRELALDRAISGRVLPRLRGPSAVMSPLVEALGEYFSPGNSTRWPTCSSRVAAMREQLSSGFVSFWG